MEFLVGAAIATVIDQIKMLIPWTVAAPAKILVVWASVGVATWLLGESFVFAVATLAIAEITHVGIRYLRAAGDEAIVTVIRHTTRRR